MDFRLPLLLVRAMPVWSRLYLKLLAPLPGLILCTALAEAALLIQSLEIATLGRAWLEALVLAILLGTAIRSYWQPTALFNKGIKVSAKTLLEVAIVLFGASLSFGSILAIGLFLILGIVAIVAASLLVSYLLGRLLGLPAKMAVLVACGNAICGNSAIAAAAPVIGAAAEDVATAIAFTAVMGVAVVLALPLFVPLLHLSDTQYGVVAGLTVYAVPQVLAATAPVALTSVQIGTLVKLIRVLMLGPVIFILSVCFPAAAAIHPTGRRRPSLKHLLPWFIVGFVIMSFLRSLGLIPPFLLPLFATLTSILTIISMAALGLGVNVRHVADAGPRVIATVTLSLLALLALSLLFVHLL